MPDLMKTPSGNMLRSNLNEQSSSKIRLLFNDIMKRKAFYAYHGLFILLLLLSFIDIILTYSNSKKSKPWEYAVGTLGFFAPIILYVVKITDLSNAKVATDNK